MQVFILKIKEKDTAFIITTKKEIQGGESLLVFFPSNIKQPNK